MQLWLIFVCIILETVTQLCFKTAADASTFWQTIMRPIIWLGIILWAIEVLLWMHVLKTTPLTVAFPIMSLTYVVTLAGSVMILKEQINKRHALGAFLIISGVACIGMMEI